MLCNHLSIPLSMGEPELDLVEELKKPVYKSFSFEEVYDFYLQKYKIFPLNIGTDSIGYAKNLNRKYGKNVVGLIVEVPLISDKKIENKGLSGKIKREVLQENNRNVMGILNLTEKVYSCKDINQKSVFYDASYMSVENSRSMVDASERNLAGEEYDKKLTVAEEFSLSVSDRFERQLTFMSQLRRLLLASSRTEETKTLLYECENKIDENIDFIKRNSSYEFLPIKNLVQ